MTGRPVVARTREELEHALGPARDPGVAFVATMGALHDGHRALLRRARAEAGADGRVVASIFVNPLQFGPGEDLERYPRTLDADLGMCAGEGVDLVFAPPVEEMYPAGQPRVTVDPGPLGSVLEGVSRPTHFRGMLTVVARLFGLVRPDVAVFGQKDYQQLVLVRRMAADLCPWLRVVGEDTVREADGLALSSRNRYLDAGQRGRAAGLSRALEAGRRAAAGGPSATLDGAWVELRRVPDIEVDYLAVTDPDLGPAPATGEGRLLVAANVGPTRLIDNVRVLLGSPVGGS